MLRILTAMLLLATPAMAVEWFSKPVQCDTLDVVAQLMIDRKQEPLLAGVSASRVGGDYLSLPTVVFANSEEKTYHVIEYNIEADQACVVSIGNGLDFNVADWYYKKGKS